MDRETGKTAFDLIHQPPVKIVQPCHNCGFPLTPAAVSRGSGSCLRLRIDLFGFVSGGSNETFGLRRLFSFRAGCVAGTRPSAPHPILHPLGALCRFKGNLALSPHPHQSETVFARKLSARARAFVPRVNLRCHDAIWRGSGTLAFTPDQTRIISRESRPTAWFHEFARSNQ